MFIRKMTCFVCAAFASGAGLANVALAHADHSVTVAPADSPLHYVLQPEHALPAAIAVAAMLFAARMLYIRNRKAIRG